MARRINLVPQAERARTTTNFGVLGFVAACILVLFALGLGYYLFSSKLDELNEDLRVVQSELAEKQKDVKALAKYGELDRQRQGVEEVVAQVYAGRTLVSELLDKLSLVVPENVWFSSMDISTADPGAEPELAFGSFSIQGSTYSFEDVAQLLVRLQLLPALQGVKLDNAGGSGGDGITPAVKDFSITATVTNTQAEDTPLPVSQVEVEGL